MLSESNVVNECNSWRIKVLFLSHCGTSLSHIDHFQPIRVANSEHFALLSVLNTAYNRCLLLASAGNGQLSRRHGIENMVYNTHHTIILCRTQRCLPKQSYVKNNGIMSYMRQYMHDSDSKLHLLILVTFILYVGLHVELTGLEESHL